jgi:hypothetical protein
MKGKLLPLCLVLVVIALALSPLCHATPSVTILGYTDKPYYKPGETGTIKFWVYNDGTDDLILKNVTIYYPWDENGLWGTNQTITPQASTVITVLGNWSSTATFTVPNDGRSPTSSVTSVTFNINTDKIVRTRQLPLTVANVPAYLAIENMSQLTMWVMLSAVFVLICGVIIVVAILATSRRFPTGSPESKLP